MKNDPKTILFKVWKFPILSETFILAQIITAIKCGFEVKILVEELINENTHEDLIEKYSIKDKIIFEDYKIPRDKLLRIVKAILLIIRNIRDFSKVITFLKSHKRIELRNVYIFHFFSKLRNFDIVHVQYGTNGRPLDLLKKIDFFPPKLVVSFHGHDLYFPINGLIENNGYYNDLFDHADLLVANTEYLKSLLENLGARPSKIKILPVSVNTDFFKPNTGKILHGSEIKLITVGRLEVVKGQKLGLECVKILKEKGYEISYLLVGAGSQENWLKKLINENELEGIVNMTGKKSQKDIRDLLQVQDVFLMTSVTDPDFGAESQGLVTAEAQACGLPVIAFDSGGVKYTVLDGKSGYIVPEGDVIAMVEKIECLIKNSELRKKMGREAVEFIEQNFSQNHLNRIWKETYEALVERSQ